MSERSPPHLLLFGASGAIGSALSAEFVRQNWQVTAVGRREPASSTNGVRPVRYDPFDDAADPGVLRGARYDAVCWAQGANRNDSVRITLRPSSSGSGRWGIPRHPARRRLRSNLHAKRSAHTKSDQRHPIT